MRKLSIYLYLIIFGIVGSCSDEPVRSSHSTGEEPLSPKLRSEIARSQSQTEGMTRWDTPWWDMSDEQMADSLRVTDGEIIISFKVPGTTAGVDEKGKVLISSQAVTSAIETVAGLGVDVVRKSKLHPSILAQIPVEIDLIHSLRNHPVIDIFEPNMKGEWTVEIEWNYKPSECTAGVEPDNR